MKKPDIFKRAEKFLGRSFPFETKCVGCGFPIKSFKFVNYQELGPTMCDDCGEKSDQKRIADDKLALQRELALQCGVDDAYRTWDREQANLLGNGALLKLIGEKKKDLGSIWVWGGNGKGKSTAAFGLALRAAGAGLKVFIGQFVKQSRYSEIIAFERFLDLITIRQFGRGCFIRNVPEQEDIDVARAGLEEARQALAGGEYQVVILDEGNIAALFKLISVDDLLELIDAKPEGVELVITGRGADQKVIDNADLVTEMREVKHYYAEGVQARRGIES